MNWFASVRPSFGRVGYGVLFCLVVPALLGGWAWRLAPKLEGILPRIHSPLAGVAIVATGVVLVAGGMWELWQKGRGLPMNAFPPERFVATGLYRWLVHPIYVGFALTVLGVSVWAGSVGGVWVVTPSTCFAMTALVVGYERIALRQRFPEAQSGIDRASLSWSRRVAAFARVFVPWLLAYEACVVLTASRHDAIDTMLPVERHWPVWTWMAAVYLGAYGWIALTPFAAGNAETLHRFERAAWVSTAIATWFFLIFPGVTGARPLSDSGWLAQWLLLDRRLDTMACAWPSFHVCWGFLAAYGWAGRLGRPVAFALAAAVAASCVMTGIHSLSDVVAGWLLAVAAWNYRAVWAHLCAGAELIANSWHDWRIGPVRVINHGGYVALAAALGLWLVGLLLGPAFTWAVITVATCGLLGAGLWGQWLEASSVLSRPFGYFGGFFGCLVGCILVQLWRGEGWLVAAAYAVAAPLIQGIGRLRCLVQGCCHGRPVDESWLGIRHTQPLSRVCRIAKLGGVPIHPTPLYSMVSNVLIFGVLLRLWQLHADSAFIVGTYFILSTGARFMEEGYRGEPQTMRFAGLAIYQWLAIGGLLAGIAITTLPSLPRTIGAQLSLAPLCYALPFGVIVWLAMGVDLPESQRRMSRLA